MCSVTGYIHVFITAKSYFERRLQKIIQRNILASTIIRFFRLIEENKINIQDYVRFMYHNFLYIFSVNLSIFYVAHNRMSKRMIVVQISAAVQLQRTLF